jgi:hypothetical protein
LSSAHLKPRELVPDPLLLREFNISSMTLCRWDADKELGFPRAVIIRGKKYRFRQDIEAFKDRLLMGASKGSKPPNPRGRSANKPQPAGGLVTG